MDEQAALHIVVYGRVQGVFFRAFVLDTACKLMLNGYVRNLPAGQVDIYAEGTEKNLETLLEFIKVGPPAAKVRDLKMELLKYTGKYSGFVIRV